jgi:hypothetical protein
MSDKIARLGIERDNDLMYYIKNGDVWATPRKQRGQPKGKPQKVAATGLEMDYSRYIYFLDGDGDVARKERHLGGGGKKSAKAKAPKTAKPSKAASPATRKSHETVWSGKGKKSEAQLDREIEECLARAKGGGNGSAAKPPAPPASKRGGKKKKAQR